MVHQKHTALKQSTNKDRYKHQRTEYQYPRRRLRYRLEYHVKSSQNTRVWVRGRRQHFDQCERTEDNLICSSDTRNKIPKFIDTRVHRQYGSTETCEEVLGNSIVLLQTLSLEIQQATTIN